MEPIEVKGPTEVNWKHGVRKKVGSFRSRSYLLISHFHNDGATVEYMVVTSTVLLQIQLAIICF